VIPIKKLNFSSATTPQSCIQTRSIRRGRTYIKLNSWSSSREGSK